MIITINVLSPAHQQALHHKHLYLRFKELSLLLFLFTTIIAILILMGRYVLEDQLAELANRNATAITANQISSAQAKQYNQELRAIRDIQDRFHYWSQSIIDITNRPVTGIIYQTIAINEQSQTITLNGVATTRAELLALKVLLASVPHVKQVDLPLGNLVAPINNNFTITVTLDL